MKNVLMTFIGMVLSVISLAQIVVINPSGYERQNEIVSIAWKDILSVFPQGDTTRLKLVNSSDKKEIPWQLEYRGSVTPQRLLMQVSVASHGRLKIKMLRSKPSGVEVKTFARFVPERMDDFAWENDRIAFRMYGKALESKPDNAWGTDVWVKRTEKLVVNDWYKKGDYHADHGEGLDYYKVGLTLGAGDIAPFIKDSIRFSGNYSRWKILDNGPLRSSFRLEYDKWNVDDVVVKVSKTISIDAGSQMNRIEVNYEFSGKDSLPVVAGIVKRDQPGVLHFDEQHGIMSYWEPASGKDGTTGLACLFPDPIENMMVSEQHLLTLMNAYNNKSLVYYNGAAWDKAGIIRSASEWLNYLQRFREKLDKPLLVEFKK